MNSLVISPHSDDAVLFTGYTLMREQPLVLTITSSFIQSNRGDDITAQQRIEEDIEAMKTLDCSIIFGMCRDDVLDEWGVNNLLSKFNNFDMIYIPAIMGGNPQHDLIGEVALKLWPKATQYATYKKGEWASIGNLEIKPTKTQIALKNKALDCYQSQINLSSTRPHFDIMRGRSEWYI